MNYMSYSLKQIRNRNLSTRELKKFVKPRHSNLTLGTRKVVSSHPDFASDLLSKGAQIKSSSNIYFKYNCRGYKASPETPNQAEKGFESVARAETENRRLSQRMASEVSISKKKSESSSNSCNNFNILEKFETNFVLKETDNDSPNFLKRSFSEKKNQQSEMNISAKLTNFIMSLNSSRRILHPTSDKNKAAHCPVEPSQKTIASRDLSTIARDPNGDGESRRSSQMGASQVDSEQPDRGQVRQSPGSKQGSVQRSNANAKSSFCFDSPMSREKEGQQAAKSRSHKNKLTIRSCAFSSSDLSRPLRSKNSSVNTSAKANESEKEQLSVGSKRSKTSTNLPTRIKINNVIFEQSKPEKKKLFPSENYVKVSQFQQKPKRNEKTQMNISISNDFQPNIKIKGNGFNVHYNNIYNPHPAPQTPIMQMNNMPFAGQHMPPAMGHPSGPHVPMNMPSYPSHQPMHPMPHFVPSHFYQPFNCGLKWMSGNRRHARLSADFHLEAHFAGVETVTR